MPSARAAFWKRALAGWAVMLLGVMPPIPWGAQSHAQQGPGVEAGEGLPAVIVEAGTLVVHPPEDGASLPAGALQPGARTVIDLSRFRDSGGTVAEVLRGVPGVTVIQGGGRMGRTKVRIRGSRADQVLIVLDGVPMDSQTDHPAAGRNEHRQGVDLETLSLEQVASIEIVRGAASSLYGAGAAAGAILIETRRGGKKRWELAQELGPGGFAESRVEAVIPGNKESWRLHYLHRQTRGEFATYDPDFGKQTPLTPEQEQCAPALGGGYRLKKCNAKSSDRAGVAWSQEKGRRWTLQLDRQLGEGLVLGLIAKPYAREETGEARGTYSDRWKTGKNQTVGLGLHAKWREAERSGNLTQPDFLDNHHIETRAGGDLWYERWTGVHQFRVGGVAERETLRDWYFDSAAAQTALFEKERGRGAVYTRWNGHLERGSLEASLRGEKTTGIAQRTTYRLGASHYLGRAFGLKGSHATGFRPPTLYELLDPTTLSPANAGLLPEDSRSVDGGFFLEFKPWLYGEVLGFRQEIDHDIVAAADPGNSNLFLFQNIGHTRTTGVEGTLNLRFPLGLGVDATYSRFDARMVETDSPQNIGNQVPYVPAWEGGLAFHLRRGGWRSHLNVRHRARRFTDVENSRILLPSLLVEGALTFPVGTGLTGTVTGKNLTNRTYAEWENQPLPGREIFFTLRWRGGGEKQPPEK